MGSRRSLSWNTALSDLRSDRAPRAEIREERLGAGASRGSPGIRLSAWRGRSGHRYVVGVHPIEGFALPAAPAVYLAVRRDEAGMASIVAAAHDLSPDDARAWLSSAGDEGATEIHLDSLSEGIRMREDLVGDLAPSA